MIDLNKMADSRLHLCVEEAVPPIVHIAGELDYGNCDELDTLIHTLYDTSYPTVRLSLEELDFVDSSGLRVLVVAAQNARKQGHTISIVSLAPQLDHLLHVSGFRPLFEIPHPARLHEHGDTQYQFEAKEITFDLPIEPGTPKEARSRVCDFIAGEGAGEFVSDDIRLAVGEAVSNAVRHGNVGDGRINFYCKIEANVLRIVLKYRSRMFDPKKVPEPDMDSSPEGGMGIYFMRLVMDEVDYCFDHELVTLVLVKRLKQH